MTDSEDEIPFDDTAEADAGQATIGARLRAARERKGLTIDQVASETRIARRHLENIETGNFDDLPGRTYAVGFTRTYAKTLGVDEEDAVTSVREEMDLATVEERYVAGSRGTFEPGDPARAPGGRLLYFSIFAVIILLVGIFFAARALFAPAAEMPSLVEQERQEQQELAQQQAAQRQAQPQAAAAAADPTGEVVFTAEGETWVRFYDGEGRVLREGTLTEGDSFTLPADAQNPQLITGRPDRLAITIGGRPVRKLSTEVETLSDVPISAEALLARTGGAQTIGFSLGTAAPESATQTQTAQAAPAAAPTLAPPRPASAPTQRPAPPPVQAPATAEPTETPDTAATAPPRAVPAEPTDDGASAEIE